MCVGGLSRLPRQPGFVMDSPSDSYPSTKQTTDTVNTTQDYSSLNSVDFWNSLAKSNDSPLLDPSVFQPMPPSPKATTSTTPSTTTIQSLSKHPKRRSSQTDSKRRKVIKNSPTVPDIDFSSLDCPDYWLRFDSDNDSLTREPTVYSQQPSQSGICLVQPAVTTKSPDETKAFKAASFWSPDSEFLDDSALDYALSEEDENSLKFLAEQQQPKGANSTSPVLHDLTPEDSLYSTTPMSWESPPQGSLPTEYFTAPAVPMLSDPEQRRLFAIAMGCGQPQPKTETSISESVFEAGDEIDSIHSGQSKAERCSAQVQKPELPRKGSAQKNAACFDDSEKMKEKPRSADRAAHNDIERKYRTNLKDRITELRDAIPSLRANHEDAGDDDEAPTGSAPPKVSKGAILSKATEYIHQLERRNRHLNQKNEELMRRLGAFEQLLSASTGPANWQSTGYGMSTKYS